jgi:hypothetical protein
MTTVLKLDMGTALDSPASSPSRVGGVSPLGPAGIAVTGDGTMVLLDSVRHRLLLYRQQKLVRRVALPFLDEQACLLMADGDLIYVTSDNIAFAVDLDGRIQRISGKGPDGFYPKERGVVTHLGKGETTSIGRDRYGNAYTRRLDPDGYVIARQSGGKTQTAREPGDTVDVYVADDGSVYTLTWTWGQDAITAISVTRIMEPVAISFWQRVLGRGSSGKGAPAGQPPQPSGPRSGQPQQLPERPAVLTKDLPSSIAVERQGAPPQEFGSATAPVLIHNLWQFLSLMEPTGVVPGKAFYRVRAAAEDFMLWSEIVVTGGKAYYWPGRGAIQMLDEAVYAPAVLSRLAGAQGASLAIPDLPGRTVALTGQQNDQVAGALAQTFAGGRYEPPQPLEPSFPQYALQITPALAGAGPVTLRLVGEYFWTSSGGTVLVDDGRLARVVKGLLPLPELKAGSVEWLYRASSVKIVSGGRPSDLTRWKNTVVRALLGLGETGAPGFAMEAFDLVFMVDGREEKVRVTAEGFNYRGVQHRRAGLTTLVGLMGVP